jgi:nitrite reductase (NADH) small subunit
MTAAQDISPVWHYVCDASELVLNSGVCALVGEHQVAIFSIDMNGFTSLYAVSNYDPIGKANVIYRGLIGSLEGEPVVASPLYKEHYFLQSGVCKERNDITLKTFAIKQDGEQVYIAC